LVGVTTQPVHERDMRGRIVGELLAGATLLDTPVPRAHVLTDVAAVHLRAELAAVLHGWRRRSLRPVAEATGGVERSRLVERAARAGVDAEPALSAVEVERRRRLELDVGDERAEHDPRAVPAGDEQRVLPVEAHAAPCGRLAVDVLVRVDEHAI